MKNIDVCPICFSPLIMTHPDENATFKHCSVEYTQDIIVTYWHYELTLVHNIVIQEIIIIDPYIIESEDGQTSAIFTTNNPLGIKQFILNTPYLNLPWHDKEKVIKKIKTYLLFS